MPTTTCWMSKPNRRLTWCPLRSWWMWMGTPTLLDISGWCLAGRAAGMSSLSHRWESLPQVYSLKSELPCTLQSRSLAWVDVCLIVTLTLAVFVRPEPGGEWAGGRWSQSSGYYDSKTAAGTGSKTGNRRHLWLCSSKHPSQQRWGFVMRLICCCN